MGFTGIVKNNSKEYPMDYFNKHELLRKASGSLCIPVKQ